MGQRLGGCSDILGVWRTFALSHTPVLAKGVAISSQLDTFQKDCAQNGPQVAIRFMKHIPPRPYPSNVYNLIDYAPRIDTPVGWKHRMCGDLRKYSLHISAIKAMIEIAGLEEYREAA